MRLWHFILRNTTALRALVAIFATSSVVLFVLWRTGTDLGDPRWGTFGEVAAAIGAFLLLTFEIVRVAILEGRARVSRARRVHAWLEPKLMTTERQGVTVTHPAGWLLVVANDTDDVIVEWAATVVDQSRRPIAAAGSHHAHGSLPPRRPLRFEVPDPQTGEYPDLRTVPEHHELDAAAEIRFRDHEGQAWSSSGEGAVKALSSNEHLEASAGAPVARRAGPRGIDGQGFSRRDL